MAICGCTTGMLFWKRPCIPPAYDQCANCGKSLRAEHSRRTGPGEFYCPVCVPVDADTESETHETSFTDRSGTSRWERAEAVELARGESATKTGFESGDGSISGDSSSDSGSSDSGGGDSKQQRLRFPTVSRLCGPCPARLRRCIGIQTFFPDPRRYRRPERRSITRSVAKIPRAQ